MAKLSEAVKVFIVERIALYETPTQICTAAKEELGVELTRQHVWTYDPTKPTNADRISKKLRAIFDATRKRFTEEIGDIAIANKAVRLRKLDRMATKAEESKNFVLTAALMEQAAKECGNAYTNRHEFTGKDGGPIDSSLTVRFVRPAPKETLNEPAKP